MQKFFTVSLLLFALVASTAQVPAATKRTLAIADMGRLLDLEEPAISPDGTRIAYLAIAQDLTAARYVNALELLDVRSGAVRTLVRGGDVAVPRWSPDGTQLGYLARPRENAALQIFAVRPGGRARLVAAASGEIRDFAWSPTGDRILFAADDPPVNAAAVAAHHDYFFAGDNDYTATALVPSTHLWLVSAAGGKPQRLTHGSWTVAPTDPGGIFTPQFAWSPDGAHAAFARVANTFSGDDEFSTIWELDLRDGAQRKVTKHDAFEEAPFYAPDGALAYSYPRDGDYNAENTVRLRQGSADAVLAPGLDRNLGGMLWLPGGRRMLVCASDRTRTAAWTIDRTGGVQPLDLGELNIVCDPYSSSEFDAGIGASVARDGTLAFLATDAAHARELYVLAPGAKTPRRLTNVNGFVDALAIGKMTELDWDGPDGFHEYAVVTYPPGFDASKKYPVVALIHGGPGLSSARDFVWEQWPLAQAIASHGYIVYQPNYRGSDDAGNAFMLAIVRDSAAGPGRDVMSGLAALEKLPFVDASRVAVSGWSYGGLLTSWLIGHEHAFKAAVSGAAVNDEFEEYNLSTSNVQDRYLLGARPYNPAGWKTYAEQSPIAYYGQIDTPTLIWGTTGDPVVPITQAYALFHALQERGVPVRFAVFPASTHGPSNPVQTADLTRLWLEWLDTHLGGSSAAPVPALKRT